MDKGTEAVTALLTETETAHGVYEKTELDGVYDQDWPTWYAGYAVDHGLGELLGHPVTAADLAAFLSRSFEAFKQIDPKPSGGWATYTARRITSEL